MWDIMKLTWLGHSCFKLESHDFQVILDPYQDGSVPGYLPVREEADLVLCSHEHKDHFGKDLVRLRGGQQAGTGPFTVEKLSTWHDDQQGALRGSDTIHILDDGTCRVAHLGDLGCELTGEQKRKLQHLDCLLIPVGGYYTIDAAQAKALVEELRPKVVVPMHFRGANFGYDVIGPVEDFCALFDQPPTYYPGSQLEISPDSRPQVAVMTPRNVAAP
jgi:L-ascorbate metabolism protein UlaG (beta-lactamase superfamily)